MKGIEIYIYIVKLTEISYDLRVWVTYNYYFVWPLSLYFGKKPKQKLAIQKTFFNPKKILKNIFENEKFVEKEKNTN